MEEGVTRQGSLIPQRCYELVTEIVLSIRRVVMYTRCGQGAGEDFHANGTGCWQSIRAKARNCVRVRGIAGKIVHTRRESINNSTVRQRLRATRGGRSVLGERWEHHRSWVIADIGRNGDLLPVEAEAVTAADH